MHTLCTISTQYAGTLHMFFTTNYTPWLLLCVKALARFLFWDKIKTSCQWLRFNHDVMDICNTIYSIRFYQSAVKGYRIKPYRKPGI